jgi:excisionase family DNA binding protein
VTARDRLEAVLSPGLIDAIEELVAERVAEELAAVSVNGSSPWLTLDEAAEYLRVSARTLERSIAVGRLRSSTIGRRRLLHRDDLERFAAAGEETAPTVPSSGRIG